MTAAPPRLDEVDIRGAHLGRRGTSLGEHLLSHVDPGYVPPVTDHLGGDRGVGAGARAEVELPLARCEPAHGPRVGDAGERLDRRLGYVRELFWIAKVLGPRTPSREDEFLLRLLGDGGVGLLDLALQYLDTGLRRV
jgi:hypothetical protein